MILSVDDRRLIERFTTDIVVSNGTGETCLVPELDLARLVQGAENIPPAKLAEALQSSLTIIELQPGREPRQLALESFKAMDYARMAYLFVNGNLKEYKQKPQRG